MSPQLQVPEPRCEGGDEGLGLRGLSEALKSELHCSLCYSLRCFYLGGSVLMISVLTVTLRKVKWPPHG